MIPAATIEHLRQRADIVTLIDGRCPLRRLGERFTGKCPFHADDERSLLVDPARRRFVCVACGAGGDVIEFIGRFERVGYVQAARDLGGRLGVEVSDQPGALESPPIPPIAVPAFRITRAGAVVDLRVCPQFVIKVGRLHSSHLLLADDPQVSRMHAVIEREPGRLTIIDLGNANGTLVNGKKVLARERLVPGDVVRIGEHVLELVEMVAVDLDELPEPGTQASARLCVSEAERAIGQQQYAAAGAMLALAWRHVADPALRRTAELLQRLVDSPLRWPEPKTGPTARWLDAGGLAQIDALQRALIGPLAPRPESRVTALELAVLLERDDDEPRIVYADWLQQRGDPRGEWIALQLAHSGGRLDDHGPERLEALWQAHGERWSAEFTRLGAEVEFRRGFVWRVHHPGLWSVALIEAVRRWPTIELVEGPNVPAVVERD